MPEVHPDGVAGGGFRCAIPNAKRYMKRNRWTAEDVARAAYEGDLELLEALLSKGDELDLFNGDLNAHVQAEHSITKLSYTALHLASVAGQTECLELLLRAKADPHIRESMPYGRDPEEGVTALDLAKKCGWDDCVELLEQGEKSYPYGYYQPFGTGNNSKCYGCWEHGTKPSKGWYMMRPGAAQLQGLDPKKYGGELADPEDEGDDKIAAVLSAAPAQKPLPIGLLFPGQGSQYVKMMAGLKDHPVVKDMLQKANDILGYDLLKLCLEGPEAKLEETAYCQPAMFTAGLAGVEKLRGEKEEAVTRCQVMAGLSLGEYTALCAAGVMTFEDGLRLVKLRGEAMQEAAAVGKQKMLSVAGLEREKLEELCKQALAKDKGVCQIANHLFPNGFAVGGTEGAINELKDLTEKAGALQSKILKTSGAFHTPLMQPAQDKLSKALEEVLPSMQPPKFTVWMNASAEPMRPGTDPKEIVELLKRQLTNQVLWEPSMRAVIGEGVTEFYECGPQKQLKAMMKRIDPEAWKNTKNIDV